MLGAQGATQQEHTGRGGRRPGHVDVEPGFEKRLSIPSLVAVYAAFGVGLALTEMTRGWRR